MRIHRLAFAAMLFLASPALALDAGDRTFQAGRVGAIVKGSAKPGDLVKIYTAAYVKLGKIHAAEGQEQPGAIIFQGTANELQVGFTEDGQKIEFVRIVGAAWATKEGLRVGTTLAELERLNGGPFQFSGFGWDYGGGVTARGRALKGIGITIAYTKNGESKEAQRVMGDRLFSSRHPALKNLGVVVSQLVIGFGN
jgi:hypothetical protein